MAEIISSMISKLFGKYEYRVLFLGLDASGRTTILYKLKLGEIVTTIPTIGFNVETVEYKNTSFTIWDVGGCDKIRPLWRHYYQNTQAVIFCVDSNDRERMNSREGHDPQRDFDSARGLLRMTLDEDELKDAVVLVLANKQDLPNAMSVEEVAAAMNVGDYKARGRTIHVLGTCGITGDGCYEGLDWLTSAILAQRAQQTTVLQTAPNPSSVSAGTALQLTPDELAAKRMEDTMAEWLTREDEEDDVFLQKLADASLESWDHRVHLRIAWINLSRHGRREGMKRIFDSIKSFIERSPRTRRNAGSGDASRGTTFHETMTYFWVHMVDYSMHSTQNPDNSFKTFLLLNPQLANGGLFLHFYTKQRMLMDAESRTSVLLPDVRPLPSLLSPTSTTTSPASAPLHERLQPRAPLSDVEFLVAARASALSGWGHEVKLRLIYVSLLAPDGDAVGAGGGGASRRPTDKVLDLLRSIEKGGFNLTEDYFWLQMVSYHIAVAKKELRTASPVSVGSNAAGGEGGTSLLSLSLSFDEFSRRPVCQGLRNSLLIDKYYSRRLLESSDAQTSFQLPDLKQLPSIVK